jgi:predicted transglutaminase-like protease
MLVFDISEFTQNSEKVLDAALTNDVVLKNNNGNSYKLVPVTESLNKKKSPFDNVPQIKLDITTDEIVEILYECRAGV